MTELTDFYYNGTDWICKRCEIELAAKPVPVKRSCKPTKPALAKWMDKTLRVLICPRCGLTESVEKG